MLLAIGFIIERWRVFKIMVEKFTKEVQRQENRHIAIELIRAAEQAVRSIVPIRRIETRRFLAREAGFAVKSTVELRHGIPMTAFAAGALKLKADAEHICFDCSAQQTFSPLGDLFSRSGLVEVSIVFQ